MQTNEICWSCKGPLNEGFFCPTCGTLRRPFALSPFKFFALPLAFNLNLNTLEERYLDLQKQFHPDKFVTKTTQEQMNALSWGGFLNDSYNKLKKPVERACLLLAEQGIHDVLEEKPTSDMMMKQFELREQLEESEQLEGLLNAVQDDIANLESGLVESFASSNFEKAKKQTLELQFLSKFTRDIKRKMRQLKIK